MSTRAQLRELISRDLKDAGLTHYTETDINNSLQDAYNDIAAKSQCIVNNVTLNWLSGINYYDFLNGNPDLTGTPQNTPIVDYLGTIGIFNNNTNLWLRDDLNIRDFDRIRIDWELWRGQSQYWSPKTIKHIAVVPALSVGSGNFILWYWGKAPLWSDDTDITQDSVVAPDMETLFEYYCMGDLLESAEEPTKAQIWWGKYLRNRESYKQRCRDNARADLLQRI